MCVHLILEERCKTFFSSVSLVMSEHEANAAFKKRNENDNNAML